MINKVKFYFSVNVPYCSSDVYTGTRNKSDASQRFYFHGHYIIEAIIDDLIQKTWITDADEVDIGIYIYIISNNYL